MRTIIDRSGLPADTKLGVQLRGNDDGMLVIDMVVAGGLAEQYGELENGDRILAINGNDVVGIPRNVIVGWLYENDQTAIDYERDAPTEATPAPKLTMKERLKARAARHTMKRGLPAGDVAKGDVGSRKTSLKTRLESRRQEAEGAPKSEPVAEKTALVEIEPVTPPDSPNFNNSVLQSVSPSVIILGSPQAVEGLGAVHVIQLMVGAVGGFELADASIDESHPDFVSQVWVHSVKRGSEAERQGMAVDDAVLAVNGQNARDSDRDAVEGLLFSDEQTSDIVTIVLAKPTPRKHSMSDEDLEMFNNDGGPHIRKVVLQRPAAGLGLALGPAQTLGGGPAVAFLAGNGPKVLRGQIKASDEVVAVDGSSLLGVPLQECIAELNGVGNVFELLIREGLPLFIHPPALDGTSLNNASMWSALGNSLEAHAAVDTTGSPGKPRMRSGGRVSRSGCQVVRLFRDDDGLGFTILGGIDFEMHGIFVTHIAPNSPASGKLAPGDLLLVANGTALFDVTHADARDTLNGVGAGESLDLTIYRNDRIPMWRNTQRLRNMFGVISFIEPGAALGIAISGGIDSKVGHIEVQQVKPDSAAATVGNIFPGDHLISVNGNVLVGKSHEEATAVLKQTGALATFLVQRDPSLSSAARASGPTHMRAFKMKKGSREQNFGIQLVSRQRGDNAQFIVRDIASNHSSHPENHLQVGDEIIAIDDVTMADKTHAEGVDLLKSVPANQHVTFVTRRLGPSDAVEITVTIARPHVQDDFGFGFSLGTSSDGKEDMLISDVDENGLCGRLLQVGDAIISINGRKTAQMAYAEKTTLIDRETQCAFVLRRFLPPGVARTPQPATAVNIHMPVVAGWAGGNNGADADYSNMHAESGDISQEISTKRLIVTVERMEQGGFGFSLGTSEDTFTKVITAVREGSSAFGLAFEGDIVLSINGVDLAGIPHEETQQLCRESSTLELELEREVYLLEVDLERDSTRGAFGFSVASTNTGDFLAKGITPLSPVAGKLKNGDRFVRINAVSTADLPDHESAMNHIHGNTHLKVVVERPVDVEILNTSLDAGNIPAVYPDSVVNSESATGNGNTDDEDVDEVISTGPTAIKTVTLVRDAAGGFGFNFDTDEHLDHGDLGLGVSVESHIPEDQLHRVSGTREGTPAFGKLFVGDLIDAINGVNAKESSHDDILDMIAGLDTLEIMVARAPTNTINISLERHAGDGGFGFSMVSRGTGQPLLVKAIKPGSPADGKMQVGDILDTMNGTNTAALSNEEAKSMVINADALEIELHRRQDAVASNSSGGNAMAPPPPPEASSKPRLDLSLDTEGVVDHSEESGNGYDAACAFAARVFGAADVGGGGVCTESEITDYCSANPQDKARLVSEIFTWNDFFAGMGTDDEYDVTKFTAGVVKAFAVAGGADSVADDEDEFAFTAAAVVSAAGRELTEMPEPPDNDPPPPPPPASPPSNFNRSSGSFSRLIEQNQIVQRPISSFDGGGFDEDDYTSSGIDPIATGPISVVTIQRQNGTLGFSIEAATDGAGVVVNRVQPGGAMDMAAGSNLQNGCKLLEVNGVDVEACTVDELKAELARHLDAVTVVYQPVVGDPANNRLTLHMSDM